MTSNYRNTLLSDDWVEIVTQQIAANPYGIAFTIEPFVLGQYHAQHGQPCEASRYYYKASDQADYEAGYADATQAWAAQVQAVNDALDEHAEDTAAYEDDILDREFWMRGSW